MTEHKFTDDEIIRALECCSGNGNCKDCPYDKTGCEFEKDALDLINRQKAENERLKREIEDLESTQEITPEAKYLVDTKADKVISLMNEIIKSQDQVKAEAIREFAERFKEKIRVMDRIIIYGEDIDNLVKEMTEGKE